MDQGLWQTSDIRLISYIHHTSEYKQYCHVGNTAKQCRLGLFQDSDFAGDLEDSKSTYGGTLCVFWNHTFVPTSWMCKKQTSVSHSSTESEIISLDTGLRLDGLLALELWDLIVSVLGNVSRVSDRSGQPECDIHKHQKDDRCVGKILILFPQMSNLRVKKFYCMCLKTMKQWSRWSLKEGVQQWDTYPEPTELLLIGCSIELILTQRSKIKYIDTKNQLADILTKGNFTRDEWNHLLSLFNISHFSSTVCSAAMEKRLQEETGENESQQKSIPMMNLTARTPSVVSSSTSSSPGRPRMDIKILGNLLQVTIDWGNLRDRHHQVIQKRIMVNLGLLKSGKVELRSPIDRRNLRKFLGIHFKKLTLIVRNLFSAEMCILQGTESWFPIERGNPCQCITKNRLIPKISSWAVTQQNLWIKSKVKCEKDRRECRTLQTLEKSNL